MRGGIFDVYAGWIEPPELLGTWYVERARGNEVISFSYADTWLKKHPDLFLDPEILPGAGRQYPGEGKPCFGFLSDIAPDRWGRKLIERREIMDARAENRAKRRLLESDYILGVHDGGRIGGIRLAEHQTGQFLTDRPELAAPPISKIWELETASWMLEKDQDTPENKWLKNLLAPGSSLGGARPKANVLDENGQMWIAKFPSAKDIVSIGAWEMVAHDLAKEVGITVPEARLLRLSDKGSTFLVKRFDREENRRIHYASAMTMLGETDGSKALCSYLDLAGVIEQIGENVDRDLRELWQRIVFSICITNADDHLRNHGFLLCEDGWQLSPAFDVNPAYDQDSLSLAITFDDNTRDLRLALEVSGFFRLKQGEARKSAKQIQSTVKKRWRPLAAKYHIPAREQEIMADAFAECERELG